MTIITIETEIDVDLTDYIDEIKELIKDMPELFRDCAIESGSNLYQYIDNHDIKTRLKFCEDVQKEVVDIINELTKSK